LFTLIKTVFFLKDVLHLKYFSFTLCNGTNAYDSLLIPLLRRMIYLEQLTLYLSANRRPTFIDGIHLNNEILDYMPQLRTFNFSIITLTSVNTYVNNQLYEDIRCSFLNGKFHQVDFYFEQYPNGTARSHIYSLPYKMNAMRSISNTFPGGLFTNVRIVELTDLYCPFDYKMYDRVARSFPFLTNLTVFNHKSRAYKLTDQVKKNNQMSLVIVFPHLTHLDIGTCNIEIAEQLLVDTKTLLPRLIDLTIPYSALEDVTENFTREATRRNCATIKRLSAYGIPLVYCKDFYLYFPCCCNLNLNFINF
jgi:hypothetical protein